MRCRVSRKVKPFFLFLKIPGNEYDQEEMSFLSQSFLYRPSTRTYLCTCRRRDQAAYCSRSARKWRRKRWKKCARGKKKNERRTARFGRHAETGRTRNAGEAGRQTTRSIASPVSRASSRQLSTGAFTLDTVSVTSERPRQMLTPLDCGLSHS